MKSGKIFALGHRILVTVALLSLFATNFGVVNAAPLYVAPSNDDFDNPTLIDTIPFSTTLDDVVNTATPKGGDPANDDPLISCIGVAGLTTVWYQYDAAQTGILSVSTLDSGYDTVIAVWTGTRGNLTLQACNDDYYAAIDQSFMYVNVEAGSTYYVEVAQVGGTVIGGLQSAASEGLEASIVSNQLVLNIDFVSMSVVGVGIYDDRDTNWQYSPGWLQFDGSGPHADTYSYSETINNDVTFAFKGSQFDLYYTGSTDRGVMSVYIDGLLVTSLDQHSASLEWQKIWASPLLSYGTHIIRLMHESGPIVDVDAIQVYKAVGEGMYEDSDNNWTYSGTWTVYTGGGPTNDILHRTSTVGDSATLIFSGTQFRLTFTKDSDRGSIDVFVDDVKIDTINAYSPTVQWQETYISPSYEDGTHTVRFVHAGGGTYIDIDAIQIFGAAIPVGPGTYDDADSNWVYSAGWTAYTGSGPFNNSMHYTNVQGASASITFTGTRFSVMFTKHPNRANVEVWIDGVLEYTFSENSSALAWQQTWTLPVPLSDGTHVVRFRNPNPSTAYIDIDAITILGPVGPGTYDDADNHWAYSSGWTAYTGSGPFNSTMHYTNVQGASAAITFTGTRFSVVFAKHPNRGNVEVWIDGALEYTFSANASALAWQQTWTLPVPLSDGTHTVEFKNPNPSTATYIDIDAITIIGPVGPGTYDDRNGNWVFSSGWTAYTGSGPYASTMRYTNVQGASAAITFTGTRFSVVFAKHPNRGNVEVWIDGVLEYTFSANASALAWQQTWTLPVPLSDGLHTVEFRNPNASTAVYIDIDAITIIGPVGPGTYDDRNGNWIYSSGWTAYTGSGPYASTMRYTNVQGASAAITFTGTQFKVMFTRHPNRGNVEVWIDGVLEYTFSANGSALAWQQTWTLPVPLSDGLHTVEFRNPNASTAVYIDIDAITILGPVGPGTYDDADGNWIYSAGWTAYKGSGPYASTMHYTNVQGASAAITFTGTQFSVMFTKHPNRGNVEVWIDGALEYTFSANASALAWQQTWTLPVPLMDGTHTVEFRNPNASTAVYIDIDAITIIGPVEPGTYDDSDGSWVYSSGWTAYTGSGPYASTMHYTNVQGASAAITFTGTQFSVVFTKHPNRGNVDVWIDGVLEYTFSANASVLAWQQTWTLPVPLSDGTHTVEFRNPNPGTATYIDIDAILIE